MIEIIILGSIAGSILTWHFYNIFKLMWEDSKLLRTSKMIRKLDKEVAEERREASDLQIYKSKNKILL